MENKQLQIAEMNKFLKGIHMGGSSFKDYLEKAHNQELRDAFVSIIESFKRHEEAITHRILQMGGDPVDGVGIMGMMGEFFEEVKLLSADNDDKVLDHAIKALEMGLKNGEKFIDENKNLDPSLLKEAEGVVGDYYNSLRKLKSLK